MNIFKKQKGFTLIELLIVIVIISILVAVVIVLIDPERIRRVASDAAIKVSINKVALSTEGFVSAYGKTPNEAQFVEALKDPIEPIDPSSCVGAPGFSDYECIFLVQGVLTGETCNTEGWTGGAETDLTKCHFRYYGGSDLPKNSVNSKNQFRLYVKSQGLDELFVYDNMDGGTLFACPLNTLDAHTLSSYCERM